MDQRTHQIGLQALEALLIGRAIIGMYFSASNLWFNDPDSPSDNDACLRIESGWGMVRAGNSNICVPTNLQRDYRELAMVAAELAEFRVQSINPGTEHSHLWLTFTNGDTLFVSGKDESYESWELSQGETTVVALAGGDLAVF